MGPQDAGRLGPALRFVAGQGLRGGQLRQAACQAARGQDRSDPDRIFEAFLSLEPEVVREAARTAVRIAEPIAPAVAARSQELLERAVDADPAAQLRLAGSITSRFVAALG